MRKDNYQTVLGADGVEYLTRKASYDKEVADRKYKRVLEQSGMDPFYFDIDWKDYQGELSLKEVGRIKRYASLVHTPEMDYVHLYLWGENSCQKTSLAYSVAKEAMRSGMRVKCVAGGDLIDMLMKNQGFGFNPDIYAELKRLRAQDLLVLDDCFDPKKNMMWKTENKDMIIAEWDRFLRKMLASKTRVIFTSNFPLAGIKQDFGKSLYELLDRNTVQIQLLDSVKEHRKRRVDGKV